MVPRAMTRSNNQDLWLFLGITFGLSCLVAIGIATGGLTPADQPFKVAIAGLMFTPALALWFVERFAYPREALTARTGLNIRVPGVSWKAYWALAWFVTPLAVLAAVGLSAMLGTFSLDLENLSTLRAMVTASPEGEAILESVTPQRMIAANLVSVILISPLVHAISVVGGEWGWRGWLLPRLWLAAGPTAAVFGHGLLWGLWQAPLVLVGHGYPGHGAVGVVAMIVFCVLLGTLLGWLRLSTGSIWPGVIAQGSIAGVMPVAAFLGLYGAPLDPLTSGLTGYPGWIVLAVLVAALFALRRLPVPPPPAPLPGPDWTDPKSVSTP